jgi:hypothetical protein
LSISLQFKIEKILGGQPMLIFTSDVWVTIDITLADLIFVASRICWWQAFQVGSGSIKMYANCTTEYSTEWWSCLFQLIFLQLCPLFLQLAFLHHRDASASTIREYPIVINMPVNGVSIPYQKQDNELNYGALLRD